jgi:hypothetical protein
MSTVSDIQPQNQNAKFIGTGEFRLAEGFLTAAAALGKPFQDFGDLSAVQYETNSEKKVILSSRRGVREEGPTRVTLMRFGYKLKLHEFRAETIQYLCYAEPGALGNYTQTAKAAVAADAIATPIKNRWYDLTIGGVEYRNLTTVTIVASAGSAVEDVDYKIDYENGSIRWITGPATVTSITISCPAILTTDALTLVRMAPKVTPIRRGIGRLMLYDRAPGAAQYTTYNHKDFYCEVVQIAGPNIDGNTEAEIEVDVKVLTPAGEVRTREQAIFGS